MKIKVNTKPASEFEPVIPIYGDTERRIWNDVRVEFNFEISECADPLERVSDRQIAADPIYAQTDGLNFPYCRPLCDTKQIRLRRSVLDRLVSMRAFLAPIGLEPVVLDGHRDLSTQKMLWTDIHARVLDSNRNLTPEQIRDAAKVYCSDADIWRADQPLSWPVHSTGGSVDMTLRKISSGEYLFMGSLFDDPDEISHADYFERRALTATTTPLGVSDQAALINRRILFNAARLVGLTHYWAEWWHFDFGTQFFARANAVLRHPPVSFYRSVSAFRAEDSGTTS